MVGDSGSVMVPKPGKPTNETPLHTDRKDNANLNEIEDVEFRFNPIRNSLIDYKMKEKKLNNG